MTKHIVIVGGGVMGACIAYYLAKQAISKDITITVIEKTGIASGASGKAGGFLALDWNDDDATMSEFARKSYELHAQLAKDLDGDKYGYRAVDTFRVEFSATEAAAKKNDTLSWLDQKNVASGYELGTTATTAQVHPGLFTRTLLRKAEESGKVTVCEGKGVSSLLYTGANSSVVIGVRLEDGEQVLADEVVICMGPWSGQLPLSREDRAEERLPISGERAHSIVIKPTAPVPAHALFTELCDGRKIHHPEVYPRPDGTVYMCGPTDTHALPDSTANVEVDPTATSKLERWAKKVSSRLSGEILTTQACYLPLSRDGRPLVGAHPHFSQLYMATGHSCWGILNSPITGLMMSELLVDGKVSCLDNRTAEALDPVDRL